MVMEEMMKVAVKDSNGVMEEKVVAIIVEVEAKRIVEEVMLVMAMATAVAVTMAVMGNVTLVMMMEVVAVAVMEKVTVLITVMMEEVMVANLG